MVTVLDNKTIKADNINEFMKDLLDANISTSEIYAFRVGNNVGDIYNIIDSLVKLKPASCSDGLYTIMQDPNGKLYLKGINNNSGIEHVELCYREKDIVKRYLIDLRVQIRRSNGYCTQLDNVKKEGSRLMMHWYIIDTYHKIDIIPYNINGNEIRYYSDYITKEYLESYLSELNTKKENEILEINKTTNDWINQSDNKAFLDVISILENYYFPKNEDKINSVISQIQSMFDGMTSLEVGEQIEKNKVLDRIQEFAEFNHLPDNLRPSAILGSILKKVYTRINGEV